MTFNFNWKHYPINKALSREIEKYILDIPYMIVSIELHDGQWLIFFNENRLAATPKFKSIESAKNWIETDISVKFNAFIELNKEDTSNYLAEDKG